MIVKLLVFCCFVLCGSNASNEADTNSTYASNGTDIKSTCYYDLLVSALKDNRTNSYLLQTTFYPPQASNPLYMTVTYNFPDNSSIDYIWSTATLYFTVHPRILSYLSLFFSYIENNRIVHLELWLPEVCSELVNMTASDTTNLLFVLTHRVRYDIQTSTEYEDLKAIVVASHHRRKEYDNVLVRVFFSTVLGFPLCALILLWGGFRGAIPYIRIRLNNSENFASIASIYWIGQTFTIFVIIMDVIALKKSSELAEDEELEFYQVGILIAIVVIEGLVLMATLCLLLLPLCSHMKSTETKRCFEHCSKGLIKYFLCCGIVSFRGIERKEARVWIVLSGLISPIIALTSHAGFIVGGWVSYENRSVAIVLLFLFSFVFLYWTFQYLYQSLNTFITYIRRKKLKFSCKSRKKNLRLHFHRNRQRDGDTENLVGPEGEGEVAEGEVAEGEGEVAEGEVGVVVDEEETGVLHQERELYATGLLANLLGFDTVALSIICVPLIFVYAFIAYLMYGLIVPQLSSIDEALVHIFKLGNFVFVVVVFLLTYKVLTIGGVAGGAARLISNDALKYWKFLERKKGLVSPVANLKKALKRLKLTFEVIGSEKMTLAQFSHLLEAKDYFEMDEVVGHLETTLKDETRQTSLADSDQLKLIMDSVLKAAKEMKEYCTENPPNLTEISKTVDDWIESIPEETEQRTQEETTQRTQEEIAQITTEEIAQITTEGIAQRTPEEIAHVTMEEIAHVTMEEIAPITTEEIAPITTEEIAHITTEEIAHITTEEIAHITTEEIAQITTEGIAQRTPEEIAHVTMEEIAPITTEEIAPITTEEIAHITTEETAHKTTEEITQRTPEETEQSKQKNKANEKTKQKTTKQTKMSTDKQVVKDRKNMEDAIREFCMAINTFRKTLVRVLGVPPMYYNKDQANALAAALVYEKVNSLQSQGNECSKEKRFLLLLSLIEEDL